MNPPEMNHSMKFDLAIARRNVTRDALRRARTEGTAARVEQLETALAAIDASIAELEATEPNLPERRDVDG